MPRPACFEGRVSRELDLYWDGAEHYAQLLPGVGRSPRALSNVKVEREYQLIAHPCSCTESHRPYIRFATHPEPLSSQADQPNACCQRSGTGVINGLRPSSSAALIRLGNGDDLI